MSKIAYGSKEINEQEIKKILVKRYSNNSPERIQDNMARSLVKTNYFNEYGKVETIMFSLGGSPPKGYAIFICGLRLIHFFDVSGKLFKSINNALLIPDGTVL